MARALYHEVSRSNQRFRQIQTGSVSDMLRSTQVTLKSPEEQARLRTAGHLAARRARHDREYVAPGVTTDQLDHICNEFIVGVQKSIPANVGYRGFPKDGLHLGQPRGVPWHSQ